MSWNLNLINMKAFSCSKGKGGGRVNPQQMIFELKHRVVLALNKLADRDTYQIACEELEKIAEGLNSEGIAPFLSCIIDTDSEQKPAVRKECIKMMATLARFHGDLMAPYLGKMIASIVKRLKDSDSAVRDSCVDTVGILSSTIINFGVESGMSFTILAKPLFEALGEQNRNVQVGSALCLARVVDNVNEAPIPVLIRMLTRIIKLLKNQHFMAKPALIEVVRSIVQAGGASTEHALAAALNSIQEALKSSDWTTRKAASIALAGIAINTVASLSPFKASCISSLESCRFDKVKPVRDSVIQAIQCWRNVAGSDTPEPSEAGSSTKENFCGSKCSSLNTAKDGVLKHNPQAKSGSRFTPSGSLSSSTIRRSPLGLQKSPANYRANVQLSNENDWHIEVAVPKKCSRSLADTHNEESEGSCVTKVFERIDSYTPSNHDIRSGYRPVNDMPEPSTMSDIFSGNTETKHMTAAQSSLEGNSLRGIATKHCSLAEETDHIDNCCSQKIFERESMESVVTEQSSQCVRGCCSRTASELESIRKQLLDIECKQSSLMDLIQEFMGNSLDSLSVLQSKVHSLEQTMDKIALGLSHNENHLNVVKSRFMKSSLGVSSPRLSSFTPRPSYDATHRSSSFSSSGRDLWDDTSAIKGRSSVSVKTEIEHWKDPRTKTSRDTTVTRGVEKRNNHKNAMHHHSRAAKDPPSNEKTATNPLERKNSVWKRVEDFLCTGDTDSAFIEALCSGDDIMLLELMDSTGPVLEMLSSETACGVLSIVAARLLEPRVLDSCIPWLHQVVDLCTNCKPSGVDLSMKVKKELLSAIHELAAMDFSNSADSRLVTQLALKLRQAWGKCY